MKKEKSRMRPPSKIVVRYVLPISQSLAARESIEKHSLSQRAAAKKLGKTQAGASYLYAKRGDNRMKQLESIQSVQMVTSKVMKGIASENSSIIDTMTVFRELSVSRGRKDAICDLHKDFTSMPEYCRACLT